MYNLYFGGNFMFVLVGVSMSNFVLLSGWFFSGGRERDNRMNFVVVKKIMFKFMLIF